jgi:cytoskeletal protein RodZ
VESDETRLELFVPFCFLLVLTLLFSLCYQKVVEEETVTPEPVEPTPEVPAEAREGDEATQADTEETPKEEEVAESPKEETEEATEEETQEAIADTNAQKEAFSCCGIAVQ